MTTLEKIQNLKESGCIVNLFLSGVRTNEYRTCGKCVLGYEGATQLEMTLNDIMEKEGRSSSLSLMEGLHGLIETQSLCGTGEEITDAMLAAIETYRGNFKERIDKKGCKAGICRKFMTCHILADRCTGCGDCMDECEEDAVLGKKRFVHVIDQDERTQYSACMSVYEENAVIKAGTVKPKCPHKPTPCRR